MSNFVLLIAFVACVRILSLLFGLAVCYFTNIFQLRGLIKYKNDTLNLF